MKKLFFLFTASFIFSFTAIAQAPTGAVGIWHMDENSGTTTGDASGNGNNGTLFGTAWTTGVSGSGSGLSFNGSAHFEVPDAASLRPGNITVAGWIRSSTVSGNQVAVGKSNFSNATNEQYVLYLESNGTPGFGIKRNSGCAIAAGWNAVIGPNRVDDGQWHHIAGTYDGSTMHMYVDGVLQASNNSVPPGPIDNCAGGTLRFGLWWQSFPDRWVGDMDEMYIYDRALTQTEVTQLFNAPHANVVPTLSEWGLIIFALLSLCIGGVALRQRSTRMAIS